jgi:hypothetical protein
VATGLPPRGAMANRGIFALWFCVLHFDPFGFAQGKLLNCVRPLRYPLLTTNYEQ